MKRLLSLMTVCALFCSPAFGQEAQSVNNYPELSIITRVDAYPFSPSVYTLLEGSLGDHFSYSVCNNWVSDDTPSLYANTFRADEADWCQWAWLSLDLGNWHIIAGKDYFRTGGFETDAYDYDQYWQLCSSFWNNVQVYQYGGGVKYVLPSESDEFMAQVTSSPASGRPFEDGLLSYNLEWVGEHGPWSSIWSVSGVDYSPEVQSWTDKDWVLSSGNQFAVTDNLSLGLDYMYVFHTPYVTVPETGKRRPTDRDHIFVGRANWRALDWLEVGARGIFESMRAYMVKDDIVVSDLSSKYLCYGLFLNFYPLKDKDDLRIHALAGKNSEDGFFWGAGITYNFPLTQTLLNRRQK